MQRLLLLLAASLIAAPAVAGDAPLLRPARDVVVQYGTGGATLAAGTTVTMHFTRQGRLIRIDPATGTAYTVYDTDANHMMIVRTDARTFEDRTSDPSQIPLYFTPDATFVKTGTDTIAGQRCTTYDATLHARKGQICLTDDGVILRARTGQADTFREMVAVTVSYTEQPLALFAPPPGFENADSLSGKPSRRPMQSFFESPGRPAGAR
jgi:hypothetical protein